jgi:hypothetical protein
MKENESEKKFADTLKNGNWMAANRIINISIFSLYDNMENGRDRLTTGDRHFRSIGENDLIFLLLKQKNLHLWPLFILFI